MGYTPIAMSTTVMTPARNLANFGAETAGSGRFEPVELTTFSETLAGRPARCSAAANTGFEFVWRLRDCYDSMGPLCSSSLSGTYKHCLLASRHLFEISCVLTNPTRCPVHTIALYSYYSFLYYVRGRVCLLSFGLFCSRGSSSTGFYPLLLLPVSFT